MRALATASVTSWLARNGLQRRCSPPICEPLALYSGYHPSSGSRRSLSGRPSENSEAVMKSIQDLVEGLSYTSPAALKELFELSCSESIQLGHRSKDPQKAWERTEESFKKKGREIIQRNIDEGGVQARLLESFDGCRLSFETLQARLDDAVHARHRMDDEELEGDEHEPTALLKEPKEWHGTEAHPCHQRWVMDAQVDVDFEPSESFRLPVPQKSILLSNLPKHCEEERVVSHLSPCGEVAHIEFCHEWQEMVEAHRDGPDTMKDEHPKFTLSYALVEFHESAARRRATRRLSRLQGILFHEVQTVKLKTKRSPQVVARPCYPQDLRLKKSLLLRGLPIHMDPHEVLQAVLRPLSRAARSSASRAELLNCCAFRVRGGAPLHRLEVEVGSDGQADVCQEAQFEHQIMNGAMDGLEHCCPSGNGGEMVLRFKSFQEAYVCRRLLQAMELGGRRIFAGFPPWRPQAVWTDSRGYDLGETRLMDLPVPRASARYSRHLDPVHWAPSNQEVDDMAQDTD